MKKTKTWILVADAAVAQAYEKNDQGKFVAADVPLKAEREEGFSEGRSQALGKTQESATSAHHIIEPRMEEKTLQMVHFSRIIAEYLEKARTAGKYQHLVLTCAPRMLGHLRTELSQAVRDSIKMEVHKDYTHLQAEEIHEQLRKVVNI